MNNIDESWPGGEEAGHLNGVVLVFRRASTTHDDLWVVVTLVDDIKQARADRAAARIIAAGADADGDGDVICEGQRILSRREKVLGWYKAVLKR